MQMLLSNCRRAPALSGAFLLVLATSLSACSWKNPLIGEPSAKAAPEPAVSSTQAKPAPQAASAMPQKTVVPAAPADTKPVAPSKTSAEPQLASQAAPAAQPAATSAATAAKPVGGIESTAPPAAKGTTTIIPNLDTPAPTGIQRLISIFKPYRVDLQQGNFVSREMLSQLREGMTKEQVRFLLGSPLLTDMFHDWRWDYLFRLQKPNGQLTANRVTIYFKDNRVERFENSQLPGEVDYLSHIADPGAKPKAAPAPAKSVVKPDVKQQDKPDERPYD